jgi:hypothetical protein
LAPLSPGFMFIFAPLSVHFPAISTTLYLIF